MPAPATAIHQEVVWKNDEVLAFAVALVKHALAKLDAGQACWTTDIVPDAERGTGNGIAGSVVTLLQNASVIEPVGIVQQGTWYANRIKSERPGAKSRWLNVYRLASRGMAGEFLARHGHAVAPRETQPNIL